MSIVLGAGAAAYQLAAGQLNTPSLNFGTVQVGAVGVEPAQRHATSPRDRPASSKT